VIKFSIFQYIYKLWNVKWTLTYFAITSDAQKWPKVTQNVTVPVIMTSFSAHCVGFELKQIFINNPDVLKWSLTRKVVRIKQKNLCLSCYNVNSTDFSKVENGFVLRLVRSKKSSKTKCPWRIFFEAPAKQFFCRKWNTYFRTSKMDY